MEDETGVTQSIIDELHSSHIQRDQMEGEIVLLKVSFMDFILGISKEIKNKMKVVLLEVSLIVIIFRISNEVK